MLARAAFFEQDADQRDGGALLFHHALGQTEGLGAFADELCLYPGNQHYFADSSLPSYDAGAAALVTRRVLDFLRSR